MIDIEFDCSAGKCFYNGIHITISIEQIDIGPFHALQRAPADFQVTPEAISSLPCQVQTNVWTKARRVNPLTASDYQIINFNRVVYSVPNPVRFRNEIILIHPNSFPAFQYVHAIT